MSAPLWVALTHHTAHLLEGAGAEAVLLDQCEPTVLKGRTVILAPSAARPGAEGGAARRLRTMVAQVSVITPDLLRSSGASDLSDLLETSEANGKRVNLELLAALAVEAEIRRETQSEASTDDASGILLRCVADVEARPVRWLWPGRFARGKVSMLAGHPGLGKSQICLSLAAVVTTGGLWPVDRTSCERGSAVIVSAEDDPEDTIRPRLEAAGADLSRCHILEGVELRATDGVLKRRGFSLADDLPRLSVALAGLRDVALVVIDPITAFLGRIDSHVTAEVRAVLAPVAEVAARHGAAVIAVSHLRKSGGEALLQVTGSLAFVAAARAAYVVAKDQENPSRRLLLPVKNNLGEDQTGYAFQVQGERLASGIETSRVMWEAERVTVTADEALAPEVDRDERSAVEDAKLFLADLLDDGPIPARRVKADADGAGHSWAAIRRAQVALGVKAVKSGLKDGWTWRLPAKVLKTSEDAQEKDVSAFGKNEHLRQPQAGSPEGEI